MEAYARGRRRDIKAHRSGRECSGATGLGPAAGGRHRRSCDGLKGRVSDQGRNANWRGRWPRRIHTYALASRSTAKARQAGGAGALVVKRVVARTLRRSIIGWAIRDDELSGESDRTQLVVGGAPE